MVRSSKLVTDVPKLVIAPAPVLTLRNLISRKLPNTVPSKATVPLKSFACVLKSMFELAELLLIVNVPALAA